MTTDVLKVIDEAMTSLELEYGFITYNKNPVVYPYFVGEYQESSTASEDNSQSGTFILTGFTRNTWLELEEAKAKIENYFTRTGITKIADSGNGIAISYSDSLVIPEEDFELKSIQINLNFIEWKVN